MSVREKYAPGSASGASVIKNADVWTLVLIRELRHSPQKVWDALTDPAQLREWAPFDADRNLGVAGPAKLSTVATPTINVSNISVKRAERPRLLEYDWGGNDIRWELEPVATGTRLKLWHNINRNFIAMGAAGWHISFDALNRFLSGDPIGRIVGGDAMKFDGWKRLHAEYQKQFNEESTSTSSTD